jgi:hypothetical protein
MALHEETVMTLLHFNSNYMHLLRQKGLQVEPSEQADKEPGGDGGEADRSSLALQRMREILRKIDSPSSSRGKVGYRTQ